MNELLSQLNEQQRAAVEYIDGPMVVFAGAGTGKTRVITYRIAYLLNLGVNPYNILAVTFTNKAAQEMKERLIKLFHHKAENIWVSTFHSLCAKILYTEATNFGLKKNFVIYDENDSIKLIKECMKEISIQPTNFSVYDIYGLICRAKDNLIDPESYKINTIVSHQYYREIIADIYSRYQKKLEQNNALDFSDLIMKTVEFLKNEQFVEIKNKYAQRFKYIHVDEYQDVNYSQVVLLKILSSIHHNVCVVGDDDQTIYTWRGSNVNYLLNFKKDFSTKDIQVKEFTITKNYRSKKTILDVSNVLINHNKHRVEKNLFSDIEGEFKNDVKIKQCEHEYEEAEFIAKEIVKLQQIDEFKNSDIAILYRTNAQSRVFEEVFSEYKIPYKIVGSVAFYDRKEIKDIIAYLRVLVNPDDTISLKRIINVPSRGIGETTILYLETLAKENKTSLWEQIVKIDNTDLSLKTKNSIWKFLSLYDLLKKYKDTMYPSEFIKFLIEKINYIKMIQENDKLENRVDRITNLEQLVNIAKNFEVHNNISTIEEFLSSISLLLAVETEEKIEFKNQKLKEVVLMTLHSAKGLEFDVVFIVGLVEGILPIWWVTEEDKEYNSFYYKKSMFSELKDIDIEEERRLCYVGITRTKKLLYLTYYLRRNLWGEEKHCIPSRFLEEILDSYRNEASVSNKYLVQDVQEIEKIDYLTTGEFVIHEKFGVGKVVDILREPPYDKVVVMFQNGQRKKLSFQHTKLKKLKGYNINEKNF
jgi:DNA helicase-2/ATP-dependent DNA helicase PcrA